MNLPDVSEPLKKFTDKEKQISSGLMAETAMYHLAFIADTIKSHPDDRLDLTDEMVLKICVVDNFAKEVVDYLSKGSTVAPVTEVRSDSTN